MVSNLPIIRKQTVWWVLAWDDVDGANLRRLGRDADGRRQVRAYKM